MDFFDPKKRRAHHIRLSIGYVLIAVAVILATLLLVLKAYGYSYNAKTGTVIQNGLMFVSSSPVAADVSVDGKAEGQTSTRLVLPSAQYTVKLTAQGYDPWERTLLLKGGTVRHVDYPFLFPTALVTTNQQLYASIPGLSTSSPDQHWLLVEHPGSLTVFDKFNLNDPTTRPATITLPSTLFTSATGTQRLKVVEWSDDSRHVLLEHTWSKGREFVVVDTQSPGKSVNLTTVFGVTPSAVKLYNKQYNAYYFYDSANGQLSLAKLSGQTVSLLLSDVLAYANRGTQIILYATTKDAPKGSVWINIKDGKHVYHIRQLPTDDTYLLDIAQYSGDWFAAIGSSKAGDTYVYKNPEDAALQNTSAHALVPVATLKLAHARYVSFSDGFQFVMIESGNSFAVYDTRYGEYYKYTMKAPFDKGQDHAQWMDGYRLIYVSSGKIEVFDYDGINDHLLAAANPGHSAYFDRDYKWLYTIGPAEGIPGRSALLRTDLVANTQ